MKPARPFLALLCLLAAAARAEEPARSSPARITSGAPIINWRLPSFTAEGRREWLVRGSEARVLGSDAVEVRELNLTVFSADDANRTETVLLSPEARFYPDEGRAQGEQSIRVISTQYEATGRQWSYAHREKKVFLGRDVRVTLQTELKDLLK